MPAASPVKRSAVEMGSGGVHDVAAKLPKIVDEAAEATQSLMHGLSAAEISNLMSKDGPIVKVVLLKEDGTQEELDADMSPKKSTPQQILGGSASFLGQFPELDLILMVRRENAAANLKVNQNKLPFPFHEAKVNGPLLLVRMDKSNEPQSVTLAEWSKWSTEQLAKPITDEMLKSLEDSDDDDEEENVDSDEDGDGDFSADEKKQLDAAFQTFISEHGRAPTEMELIALLQTVDDSDDEDYEEEGEEDDDDEEDGGAEDDGGNEDSNGSTEDAKTDAVSSNNDKKPE